MGAIYSYDLDREQKVNDQQFDRTLRSIGKECFVTYFCEFANSSLSNEDVAEMLMRDTDYTEGSCRSRTSHARRIIREGRARDALMDISVSRVPSEVAAKAERLAAKLES